MVRFDTATPSRTQHDRLIAAPGSPDRYLVGGVAYDFATGNEAWAKDPRFIKNSDRIINRKALADLLYPLMKTRTTAEWIKLLEDKAVPCGPINNVAEAFADEQVIARGLHVKIPRDAGDGVGTISTVASPLRLTGTPPVVRRPPPAMGQHTDEILAEMGRSPEQIAKLHEGGVV